MGHLYNAKSKTQILGINKNNIYVYGNGFSQPKILKLSYKVQSLTNIPTKCGGLLKLPGQFKMECIEYLQRSPLLKK